MSDPTTTKTRTITLTDRPPVTIKENEWPIIAIGSAGDNDSDGRGNPPNRTWTRTIRVRQHADGRAIVYGVYDYDTAWQGESGATAKRGSLLTAQATPDEIIAAIREVGDALATAEDDAAIEESQKDSRQWRVAVHDIGGGVDEVHVRIAHTLPVRIVVVQPLQKRAVVVAQPAVFRVGPAREGRQRRPVTRRFSGNVKLFVNQRREMEALTL